VLPPESTIREATTDDAGAISGMIASLARYFLADPDEPEAAAEFFQTITPAVIARHIAGGQYRYHVAELDGELAGAVGVRDAEHLYHLFVPERFHGRGIGGRLWEVARGAAMAQGNPGRFTVNSSDYAIPLYERLGFTATGPLQVMNGIAFMPMQLVLTASPG
jgi:GNAT superfamily N-acetyltransferase